MDHARLTQLLASLDRHPRVALLTGTTPVRKLALAFPRAEVWLKDDSVTHALYGGNKPRKLEYLIAKAKARGQGVVTFGFESSNHALACALHCSRAGVPCHLVLVRGPDVLSPGDEAAKACKIEFVRRLATSVETVADFKAATRAGIRKWLLGLGRIQIIPPGGSNALGTLGYVRAGLELAAQVENGELPEPRSVFVPLGTAGTAVGIAIGLAAGGLATRVVAVKVVPGAVNERPRLKWLARRVGRLVPELTHAELSLDNLEIESEALGAGYGAPTPEGLRAIDRWLSDDGVKLEATYSGKAAAALERRLSLDPTLAPALFWLTYSEATDKCLQAGA